PLSAEWTGPSTWRIRVPVGWGENRIDLESFSMNGSRTGEASLVVTGIENEMPVLARAGELFISEIMYHPADPRLAERAAGYLSAEDFEFIELWNPGSRSVDLRGSLFAGGIDFAFSLQPSLPVAAGERVILARNSAAFAFRYGTGARVVGSYGVQKLRNGGEMVTLKDIHGRTIEALTYDDRAPWPAAADGVGGSLVRRSPNGDPADPFEWKVSLSPNGSPGERDGVIFSGDPTSNEDGDLLPALLEYAFGSSDRIFSNEVLPEWDLASGEPGREFVFFENEWAGDLDYEIEFSSDLVDWAPDRSRWFTLSVESLGQGLARRLVRLNDPPEGGDRDFVRVRVSLR
ncbi:MAG: lamin tail domain-containing protein, partial [Verrucomicrobiota bacterium]